MNHADSVRQPGILEDIFGTSGDPQPVNRPCPPELALRVGITGARSIPAVEESRIVRQLHEVLSLVQQEMQKLALREDAQQYYLRKDGKLEPQLYMLSPLARGGDRLAATAARSLGYKLRVPMPFSEQEYRKDFTGNVQNPGNAKVLTAKEENDEFDDFFKLPVDTFEWDGARAGTSPVGSEMEDFSYEVAGHFVVRHCDLLIAVWNGKPSKGRGGTAEILYYAAKAGVPIWWINVEEDTWPRWLANVQDLRDPILPEDSPVKMLSKHFEQLIPKPETKHEKEHNWISRLAKLWTKPPVSPALMYFREQPHQAITLWKTYAKMMDAASAVLFPPKPKPYDPEPGRPDEPVPRYWYDLYAPADALAVAYRDKYRSAYVIVIGLTAAALVLGALALGFAMHVDHGAADIAIVMACGEFLTLIAIFCLVATSLRLEWHQRSIEYRLLADLFRKQQALAPLGWALSIGSVQHLADSARLSWISWLFAAAQRGAPMMTGKVQNEASRTKLVAMVDSQITYHCGRHKLSEFVSARFGTLGAQIFLSVLVCVALKIYLHQSHEFASKVFGLLAMVLPGISAAFVALRSYAELELLSEQSRVMMAELENAKRRIQRLNLERDLVSQDLGTEATAVATLMLEDLQGWGRLFRGKTLEAE